MNIIEELYNKLPKNIFDLKIIHHGATVNTIFEGGYFKDKVIKLSDKLIALQVNDQHSHNVSIINKIQFENPNQVVSIVVPKYEKWLSKPKELINYIETNYSNIPDYILYTDGTDVAIMNDIMNPESMLQYYKCDVLFNCEPNFAHTGFDKPSVEYYGPVYEKQTPIYQKLNKEKYGVPHLRSLNAGVFLGKKDAVLTMLKEAVVYMEDDPSKGFPYGCLDDQVMFRELQNTYFDKISVDVYNNFFLFGYPKCLEVDETDWEHFEFFKKTNGHLYTPPNPVINNDTTPKKKWYKIW
jgi:hypothetical protein